MPLCSVDPVRWNSRQAFRLSNGQIELTVLTGGGHIADFRLCGHAMNALWEAPWQTIEPQSFSPGEHAQFYGDGPVGKFLSGYTGHAVALGYFGMPSPAEAARGLPLHGEAATAAWNVVAAFADENCATLAMEVSLPIYGLHLRREIVLPVDAYVASFAEIVTNLTGAEVEFQWVQHAAFGEPLFAKGKSALFVSARRGITWPAGYEDHELLASNVEFQWPCAPTIEHKRADLSQPFLRDGTGFVAALLAEGNRGDAFIAVHNRGQNLVVGYSFDPKIFPWIALWEENCAREQSPWNRRTRVRGAEFGTSPMPLGLDHARQMRTLFGVPVLCSLPAGSQRQTEYLLFLHSAPPEWSQIKSIRRMESNIVVQGSNGAEINLPYP